VLAVATNPNLGIKSVGGIKVRAQRINQRLNEDLWQEKMQGMLPDAVTNVRREEALRSKKWEPAPHHLTEKQVWELLCEEAAEHAKSEPVLASFLHMSVIMHGTLEKSLAFFLSNKLQSKTLLGTQLMRLIIEAYEDDHGLIEAAVADLQAVKDRDPACETYVQCLLFFKGFQAIQVQRVSHWMWKKGRKSLALALQSRMSEVFSVDIHPAATLGRGLLMDHATSIVIGETAIVGDNVSMLHHVTLGGSGTGSGARHPTIGNGVLLGAGVSVLGPVVIGHCSKVGAGSVVVSDIEANSVAVGVPARVVKKLDEGVEPNKEMDQIQDFILDYII
jgi:serine O-acetyltransferase